jgi:hypothetical protein
MVFLSEHEKRIQRIDASTGLSPELLYIIQDINRFAFCSTDDDVSELTGRLKCLKQTCSESDVDKEIARDPELLKRAVQCTEMIAESYLLSSTLYFEYRIIGYVVPLLKSRY